METSKGRKSIGKILQDIKDGRKRGYFENAQPTLETIKNLTAAYYLSGGNMAFRENNFGEKNLIIATHLMMQG